MPHKSERKVVGLPRGRKGEKLLLVRTSKSNIFIVNKLKRRNK